MIRSLPKSILTLAVCGVSPFLAGAAGTATPATAPPVAAKAPTVNAPPAVVDSPLPEPSKAHVPAADLPPFLGVFGSPDLIAKVGFRGKSGSYIELQVQSEAGSTQKGKDLRIAEVGPEITGGRWMQVSGTGGSIANMGLLFLATGLGRGNVKRILVSGAGGIPMELPIQALGAEIPINLPENATGGAVLKSAKYVGKETITVPLGKFETEHWVVAGISGVRDYWTTKDPRIPFTGLVKITTSVDSAVASKVGTDAVSTIPVPSEPATK